MLKRIMQKMKDACSSFIGFLKTTASSVKCEKNDLIKSLFGKTKKERLKRVSVFCCFVFITGLAIIFSLVASLNKVVINDGKKTACVYTLRSNPLDVLKGFDLESNNYKVTSVDESADDTTINLRYTFPVYVTCGDKTTTVDFISGDTVKTAVKLAGIELDKHDKVNLPLSKKLFDETYIDVIDIDYITEAKTEAIPFTQKTVYDNNTTSSAITTKGVNGVKTITTLTKTVNGVKESSEVSEEITKPAVQQVYTVGTKKVASKTNTSKKTNNKKAVKTSNDIKTVSVLKGGVELDSNGNPINFKKHITVQATAYSCGTHTASGMKLQPGCVAVNPKIFPYGTKFYIKSSDGKYVYGYAVAGDTGGFIKKRPTNFDLYFYNESDCINFGRRNIEVWVLE